MAVDYLHLERHDGVATLTIDRPEVRNAVTGDGWDALHDLFDEVARDETVRVLVVTGAGDDFCSGADMGGGAMMDIGCYPISLSRFLFGQEPERVFGAVEIDPRFQTDRLASGVLEFGAGTSTFTCSTQLAPYQRVHIFGTEGRVEIEIPFNAPPDAPCKMWHQRGEEIEVIQLATCDQYGIQGDLFARAILERGARGIGVGRGAERDDGTLARKVPRSAPGERRPSDGCRDSRRLTMMASR